MTDKEKKSKIADILMDFQEEYSNEVINRPMLASLYAGNILSFINSLQEEPKFKTGDRIKPIDSCLGSPRTIVDVCDSWYVTDQGTLDFEFEDNWELVEEPISEDLEKEMDNYLPTAFSKDMDGGEPRFTTWFKALRKTAIHFANWQKQQMMKDAIETDILGDGTGWLSFGYLPECEYDFKEKERVKLIIIKED